MGGPGQYSIPFRGLKEGRHNFHFDIDNTFFDHFESSEIKEGNVAVRVELENHSRFLELRFYIAGTVKVICDRCLDSFPLDIEEKNAVLYVRFGEENHEQTAELIILSDSENEINLAQYIYEFIHLALPSQRIHPEKDGLSGCNPEMTEKLKEHSAGGSKTTTDPRWDKLKGIG